jgi:LCP family protein required for cell wall assembly
VAQPPARDRRAEPLVFHTLSNPTRANVTPPDTPSTGEPPQYTRYRATPRVLGRRARGEREQALAELPHEGGPPRGPERPGAPLGDRPRWRRALTPKRLVLGLISLIVGWLVLSLVLFLVSATFEQQSPTDNLKGVLQGAGYPLFSANNILVLGSDQRPTGSHEPGASTTGPSRSDVMMLIRTGGGHSARLSIPRDTLVNIPGYGLQKINAAYYFGGARLAIQALESYLGIPINHLVEMNFTNFPDLINALGGVTYTGGCVYDRVDGGYKQGGVTVHLKAGTHHLDGKQALALARVRHNSCAPNETDLNRAQRQQKILDAIKSQLLSPTSFFRLPWIAWDAPRAIISDMSAPTLLAVFGALGIGGTPATRLLEPSGTATLPDGEQGLVVSDATKRAAVRRFLAG